MDIPNSALTEFFATHEWYDNSRVKIIRGCRRKAFFSLIGPTGSPLATKVGDGANFGSAIHAGLARYYNGWGHFPESTRRIHAARAFCEEWSEYFPHERMQNRHSLDRGLIILEAYFDHYLSEDELYEPVESELGFCIEMVPDNNGIFFYKGDIRPEQINISPGGIYPVRDADIAPIVTTPAPFWYIGRIDGIFKRRSTGELYLRETKTTGSAADRRCAQLKFDHQPVGYTYCVRHLAGDQRHNVSGVIGDVILVAAQKIEFARDYFHVTNNQAQSWRRQLINTIEDWRGLRAKAGFPMITIPSSPVLLDVFHQDTERCFEYGKCAFYELCDYGISADSLADYEDATWNPLLKRTPPTVEIVAQSGDIKEIRR